MNGYEIRSIRLFVKKTKEDFKRLDHILLVKGRKTYELDFEDWENKITSELKKAKSVDVEARVGEKVIVRLKIC